MTLIGILYIALGIMTAAFIGLWIYETRRHPETPDRGAPGPELVAVGFFANFFDALGIGSFATTTTYFRLRRLVRDELIPGTLNVGHCLPTVTQALIGIAVIAVDPSMLALMILTAVAGAWCGAGVVSRLPRRTIQVGMGIALLVAAGFLFAKVVGIMPSDQVRVGTNPTVLYAGPSSESARVASLPARSPLDLVVAGRDWSEVKATLGNVVHEGYVRTAATRGVVLGVGGLKLALALAGSFFLGAIMPLGIGYYAPCMVLIALLGMSPSAAFPIMMGACAFLMPVAGVQFARRVRYSLRAAVGLAVGGIFGSALALSFVNHLPLYWVMWLVIAVVVYTAASLLRTAARERREGAGA
jgi:uncharacterized membrane protein YfcA